MQSRTRSALILLLIGFAILYRQDCLADSISVLKPKLSPAGEAVQSGIAELDISDLTKAKQSFQHALELNPKHVPALIGMFRISLQEGNIALATSYIQRALQIDPSDADVQGYWAHFLFFQKRFPEAEAAYKASLTANPTRTQSLLELGDLYLTALHKIDLAIQKYREVLALESKNERAHIMLAKALSESQQFDAAEKELQTVVQLDSQNGLIWNDLAGFLYRRNKLKESLAAYDKTLLLQPNFAPARVARGALLLDLAQPDKALVDFLNATNVIRSSPALYVDIGLAHEQLHQDTEAEQAYRTALKIDPKSAAANNNLAFLLATKKSDLAEAEACASKAVAIDPKEPLFYDTLGWVYYARGDSDRALKALTKASALMPANPEILYHFGLIYSDLGQTDRAIRAFQKMLAQKGSPVEQQDARAHLARLTAH